MNAPDKNELQQLVREVLREQLGALKSDSGAFASTTPSPQVRDEAVSIGSNADLMAFVHRLLDVAKDGRARREIEAGRWVFHLSDTAYTGPSLAHAAGVTSSGASPSGELCFERGLVSERQLDAAPVGIEQLVLGKRAHLTPLARDRARQRGIRIVRRAN